MFAIVRTGGKQYRVAAGDKIVVEKLAGEAGDTITLGDVLLAGEGGDLKSTDGLTVSAEIIAQAKADKVTVFKKKRRHNYRRKRGHRQQLTILQDRRDRRQEGGEEEGRPGRREGAAPAEKAPAAEKPAESGCQAEARGSGQGRRRGGAQRPRPRRRRRPPRPRRPPRRQGRSAEKVDKEAGRW